MNKSKVNFENIIKKSISGEDSIRYLKSVKYRENFIDNYKFFKSDGNLNIYIDFIENTNISMKGQRIDSAISLAEILDYTSDNLNSLIEDVLNSKRHFFLKLTCLDYLLWVSNIIDKTFYDTINIKFFKKDNPFLKLQANVNLLIRGNDLQIEKNSLNVLKKAPYPNIFYRFFNAIELIVFYFEIPIKKKIIKQIINLINERNFSKNVKKSFQDISFSILNSNLLD